MKKLTLIASLLATLALASCKKEITAPSTPQNQSAISRPVLLPPPTNEILVKFKKGTADTTKEKNFRDVNSIVKEHLVTKAMQRSGDDDGLYLLTTTLDPNEASGHLKNMPDVEYAEPNYIIKLDEVSNDPYYASGQLWGINGQWGCHADQAWAAGHTGSSSVYVGVLDQGAMFTHEDLAGNFWTNPYDPPNGIDDDGNGYADDIHGWDFFNNDNSTYDMFYDQHGTHVSGTLGAEGGNGVGVAGVNWNVTIISAKFIGDQFGTTEDAIKAIDYITDLKLRHGLNIVATNNSWGGGEGSQALKNAITRAGQAGILFVAAAGNDAVDNDTDPHYPAAFDNDNIISVAAIDNNGALATFSNWGAQSVDLAAPGWWIYSTVPGEVYRGVGGNQVKIISTYNVMSGTSMACPHVTGACALYASTHPGATAGQIKQAILSSVTPIPSLQGKTVTGGSLNMSGF